MTTNDDLTTKQIARLESLKYITPPVCQGQIVEVSYAGVADGSGGGCIVQRRHDRSDDTVTYYVRNWEDGEEGDFQNGEPGGEFSEIDSTDGVLRMI